MGMMAQTGTNLVATKFLFQTDISTLGLSDESMLLMVRV